MKSRSVSAVRCIGFVVSIFILLAAGRVSAGDSRKEKDIEREQAYELLRREGGSGDIPVAR